MLWRQPLLSQTPAVAVALSLAIVLVLVLALALTLAVVQQHHVTAHMASSTAHIAYCWPWVVSQHRSWSCARPAALIRLSWSLRYWDAISYDRRPPASQPLPVPVSSYCTPHWWHLHIKCRVLHVTNSHSSQFSPLSAILFVNEQAYSKCALMICVLSCSIWQSPRQHTGWHCAHSGKLTLVILVACDMQLIRLYTYTRLQLGPTSNIRVYGEGWSYVARQQACYWV